MVLEKTLESPLDCREIQPVNPKGDQSWVFIGGIDVEAETPIPWSPHAKSWLIWKDPDAGKDWGQEEKGMTEDEMVGWHHRLSGHGFGWTRELVIDREAWRAAVHGIAKSQTWLSNWTELNWIKMDKRSKQISAKKAYRRQISIWEKVLNHCCMRAQSLSHVQLCDPWTVARQASLSMGFFQARILKWVAISVSRQSSWLRDHTHISCMSSALAGGFFTTEPPGKS